MGDVVNLKRLRKSVARDQAQKQAEINRAQYGRTKAERSRDKSVTDLANSRLDQHRNVPEDTR